MTRAASRFALPIPVLLALAAACDGGGGTTGPQPAARPSAVVVEDPAGDTFGTAMSAGLVQPDIVRLTARQEDGVLVVIVEFASPVVADPESPNAAPGLIDLDTDRNAGTGIAGAADAFRPANTGTAGLGVDVGVSVRPDGEVAVFDLAAGSERRLRAAYAGREITVRLPFDMIGGDGEVNLAAVFGTLPEPTDLVPNSGHVAVRAGDAARAAGPSALSEGGRSGAWPPAWDRR